MSFTCNASSIMLVPCSNVGWLFSIPNPRIALKGSLTGLVSMLIVMISLQRGMANLFILTC